MASQEMAPSTPEAGKQRAWGVDTYGKWDNLDSDSDSDEREEAKGEGDLARATATSTSKTLPKDGARPAQQHATHFDFGDGKLDILENNLATELLEEATRKRIRSLDQGKSEIWQVVVRKLRVWSASSEIVSETGEPRPCRPFAVTISCLYPEGRLLAQHLCDPPERPPQGPQVFQLLARAFLNPTAGAQRRPKAVTFADVALAGALYRGLESLGIETSQLSESEGLDEVVAKFSTLLVQKDIASIGPTSENPGLLASLPSKTGISTLRSVYAAAADLARAAPWKAWHERRLFKLSVSKDPLASNGNAYLSVLGRDGGGTFGLALFFSKLDAEARLVPEGEKLYTRPEEPRCAFTGQSEKDLGHALKRTKPRKMDLRTGKELVYADANALRSHWPAVRKFAIALDEFEAGRARGRKYWLGKEATILFEDATLLPFDDLDSIDKEGFAVVSAEEAPTLGKQRFPVFLHFKDGSPVTMNEEVLAWLERAARVTESLFRDGAWEASPPFATRVEITLEGGESETMDVILEERFPSTFHDSLRSGVRLCQTVNAIWPRTISKIRRGMTPQVQSENVNRYLDACRRLGLADEELFRAEDLVAGTNLDKVAQNVLALRKLVHAKVPHQDLQMLLIHVAGTRRKFRESTLSGNKGSSHAQAKSLLESRNVIPHAMRSGAPPTRPHWRQRRPPPPPTVAEQKELFEAGTLRTDSLDESAWIGQNAEMQRGAYSPSVCSVSSASSLSTLESWAGAGSSSANTGSASAGQLNTMAILEAAFHTGTMVSHLVESRRRQRRGSTSSGATRKPTRSGSFGDDFEAIDAASLELAALVMEDSASQAESTGSFCDLEAEPYHEDSEWILLQEPMAKSSSAADAGAGPRQALSAGRLEAIFAKRLEEDEAREAVWGHVLDQEQMQVLRAPWRGAVLRSTETVAFPPKDGDDGIDENAFTMDADRVRALLIRGVPAELRAEVWLLCSGAMKRMAVRRNYYLKLVQSAGTLGEEDENEVGGSSPANAVDAKGQAARSRVLGALQRRNSGVVDPQGRLASLAEFTCRYCSEEAAFWLATQVCEYMVPLDHFASGLSAAVDQYVLSCLLHDAFPQEMAHLQKVCKTAQAPGQEAPPLVARLPLMDWVQRLWVCAQDIPTELTMRIWDLFVFDGERVLFACTLALVAQARTQLLKTRSLEEARKCLCETAAEAARDATAFCHLVVTHSVSPTQLNTLRNRYVGLVSAKIARHVCSGQQGAGSAMKSQSTASHIRRALLRFQKNQRTYLRKMQPRSVDSLANLVATYYHRGGFEAGKTTVA
ncbi:TBC1 domain family member 8B [Hondaea fermentalgiana]|uniref:TBC1 domain family member 8B n=1 Tax=Hondaea fermentalgiana TaxID=2315210 RepID=A0A2R5G0E3_9STRA|nr:TBC1 domain family member 8B [Hondaea fermentalgiana]|eukprot:GBG24497.1 TBC1 domain family member 8B [Hondaea fermentalgiana]